MGSKPEPQDSFRIAQFRQYSCKQRWEDTLLNNFKKEFGKPREDLLVCMGDWNETEHYGGHKRGLAPRGSVGRWYKLLMRRGYKIVMVDEDYTSKRCSKCKSSSSECNPISEMKEWQVGRSLAQDPM